MRSLVGKITVLSIVMATGATMVLIAGLFTAVEVVSPPSYSVSRATVHSVSAASWLVFDVKTGEMLYGHNADEERPIASVTKLPVARMVFDSSRIWATTTVTWNDLLTEGEAGHLYFGEEYQFYTLLFPLLLESSNDAAAVLQREFSALIPGLNHYVSLLGLTHTHFADASGLSPENVSTASELATLFREVYYAKRHVVDITSLPQYLSATNGWLNNNPVAKDERYLGGKQGYTPEAGKTLVAAFLEPLSNGAEREVGYVLLGSDSLTYDLGLLRNHVQNHVSFR